MAFNLNSLLDSAGGFLGIGGDPFSTPIGQKVLEATEAELESIDWNLNLTIVDIVNTTEDGPKEAMRAVRRRIQNTAGKEERSVFYALILLETLAKNCGKRFHLLICNREFANELITKVIPLSTNAQLVQDKILSLIQSWAHAFSADLELQGVAEVYMELKKKGVEFPPPSDDDILLVQKNQTQVSPSRPPSSSSSSSLAVSPSKLSVDSSSRPGSRAQTAARQSSRTQAAGRVLAGQLSERQVAKLNEDLRRTEETILVLSQLLSELTPGQEDPEDVALMQELSVSCKAMQGRVMELLQILEERNTVQRLLDINDNFNNVFIRYDRYKRNTTPEEAVLATAVPAAAAAPAAAAPVARPATLQPPADVSSRPTSSDAAQLVSRPHDFEEMEEWMKNQDELEAIRKEFQGGESLLSPQQTAITATTKAEGGATPTADGEVSEEFSKFLQKRADVAKES